MSNEAQTSKTESHKPAFEPKLGIQGPVVSCQDPWAGDVSDEIMRTGTGTVVPAQDPKPDAHVFIDMLKKMHAQFYVHHTIPGRDVDPEMITDMQQAGLDICLGNEYGNINGPWIEETNRYDIPDPAILRAVQSGRCIGLLYDEPEHLQINASQYRKDGWYPQWAKTDHLSIAESRKAVEQAVRDRVEHVQRLVETESRSAQIESSIPLISEHVFPTQFHTYAKAGMDLCPKVMKESFQSLQLATALGAAKQYNRRLWICADLWGPDVGEWFTRFHGFPGHSPEEFESALKMAYYMSPDYLFVENIDVLMQYNGWFERTAFGDVWDQFAGQFVAEQSLTWHHSQVDADIVLIHADDSNYGQNERLFGNRHCKNGKDITYTQSVFHMWHVLSHGTIPAHGSCMHIDGYDFPRRELKNAVPVPDFPLENGFELDDKRRIHPLFYPLNNALVFDDQVTDRQIGKPKLIMVGGSTLSVETLRAVMRRAEDGAVVVIAEWLLADDLPPKWKQTRNVGNGYWHVTTHFLSNDVREVVAPFIGSKNCWRQRFADTEVRIYSGDDGFTLDFDIV